MSDRVISVEHLSKRYFLGRGKPDDGLRHAMERTVRSPLRWLRGRRTAMRPPRSSGRCAM